ncbi:MAG: tetratricopeptide repeat protein [Bacteroidota bacterium]|nr:tetratricopeptide repeat protein [Bacteroidota bacterium]
MKTIDFSYFIERYNAGEMDESEKLWFQKEMDGNPELKAETELRRKTDEALKKRDIINLREKLVLIENQAKTGKPPRGPWREFIRYAAAFAGVAVLAGGLLLIPKHRLSNDEIIDKFYSPYDAPAPSRAGTIVSNADYNLALEYYKVKDYRSAAVYFSKVIKDEPRNMNSWLMNGISNFEVSNYPEAKSSFETVIEDDNNLYIDHAQWYLGLCYIKTGELEKARQQMTVIGNSENVHRKEARKILKGIK